MPSVCFRNPNFFISYNSYFSKDSISICSEVWDRFKQFFQYTWTKVLDYFVENGYRILLALLIIAILLLLTFLLERICTRLIKRFGRKNEWADEVINGIAFIGRLFILIIGVGLIASFGGLPEELGLTITAIVGAAIGLASTKTIGNIISGFSILISRPYSIGDYIRIGDVEGIVTEITVNYTKIITRMDRTILVSNQTIQSSNIVKFRTEDAARTYTVYPEFNTTLTTKELKKVFTKVINDYVPKKVINIKYELVEITYISKKYEITFVFDFVDDYFTIPTEFLEVLMLEYERVVCRKTAKAK